MPEDRSAHFTDTPDWEAAVPSRTSFIVLGQTGQGKTTLTAAISRHLAGKGGGPALAYETIDRAVEEGHMFMPMALFRLNYDYSGRRYEQIDCRRHSDCVKALVTGAGRIDAAILVVSDDGPMVETMEHIRLARSIGLPMPVIFLNRALVLNQMDEDDRDLVELTKIELAELLSRLGYPGDDAVFVEGSALFALQGRSDERGTPRIEQLLRALDTVPPPVPPSDRPFLMPVKDVRSITGRGTVVTGRIEAGVIEVPDVVEIVGMGGGARSTVTGVEIFRRILDRGQAGDDVGLLLYKTAPDRVCRGQVLAAPGSIASRDAFEAELFVLLEREGGRPAPILPNARLQLQLLNISVPANIALRDDMEMMPGDNGPANLRLADGLAIAPGLRFTLHEGARIVGAGVASHRPLDAAGDASLTL